MLKSIYSFTALLHQHQVCIQGERGEHGSSLEKARFMLAPIAQPCMHLAAANLHKSGRRSRHRIKNQGDSPTALPSSEGGTPERASPLEGQGGVADLGGSTAQRRAPPKASAAGRRAELRRASTTTKRPTGTSAPLKGARETGEKQASCRGTTAR